MPGIDPTVQLRGAGLIRIRLAVGQFPTACIKGEGIASTQAVASLGHYTGRTGSQRDLPVTGMAIRQCLIDFLPMSIG